MRAVRKVTDRSGLIKLAIDQEIFLFGADTS